MEFVLVRRDSEFTVEILESSYEVPWFDSKVIDLRDYCRSQDLMKTSAHFKAIPQYPTDVSFSVRMQNDLVLIYCSSEYVKGDRLSTWMRFPQAGMPSQYLQDAVHDMKSPVNAIIGMVNLMQHDLAGNGESELKTYLDLIRANAHQSVSLLNEVMELAEMENSNYVLDTEKVDVGNFVEVYLNTHRLLTLKKKIKVHFEKHIGLGAEINTMKMTRVFDNIISNAVKFSEYNSNIYVDLVDQGKFIAILIKDEGIGMPEKIKKELFIRFGNAKRRGLEGENSNGLGMSIVKQIMDLHDGTIHIESEEGKGTEVVLQLKKTGE